MTKSTDVRAFKKVIALEDVKSRMKTISRMEIKRPELYAYIIPKLSYESIDEVKRHSEYPTFSVNKDPLELWLAVKVLHSLTTNFK